MQSPGSAHAQFRRALDRGNLLSAISAARELPVVGLADALDLLLLLGEQRPDRSRLPQLARQRPSSSPRQLGVL